MEQLSNSEDSPKPYYPELAVTDTNPSIHQPHNNSNLDFEALPNTNNNSNNNSERLLQVDPSSDLFLNTRTNFFPILPTQTHASYLSTPAAGNSGQLVNPGGSHSALPTGTGGPPSIMTGPNGGAGPSGGINLVGGISSVKPVVDQNDRLWAELDVLDEVEIAAEETDANGSFFSEAHAKVLRELQQAQLELIKSMSLGNGDNTTGAASSFSGNGAGQNRNDVKNSNQQFQSLWEQNDIESLRNNLFNQAHFDNVYNHVTKTVEKLDQVAEKMKDTDKESQEMWQSN